MTLSTFLTGLYFAEGPRWREGALWFSDMHGHAVIRATLDGRASIVVAVSHDRPSGLGWLPDGRLLIVAMETQKLLRVESDGAVVEHADLSLLARGSINDMVVASDGTAYVGDAGRRIFEGQRNRVPGQTIRVTPDGEVSCAADGLEGPNGHVLTDDERVLVIAERHASRLTAFDVRQDGTLKNRRTFAEFMPAVDGTPSVLPDGICLDVQGAVWTADTVGARVLRVRDGGEVTETITYDDAIPIACAFGGDDRQTLFICAARVMGYPEVTHRRASRIDAYRFNGRGAARP